ncbi:MULTISPECIES: hypothetical protein [Halocynthiibacter]|uniref:Cation/multidrug efflux pump n=1 Tax=Halocynthiibacter halioticoli TaxID=2986804 RepID=A0AAE3LPH7_9RHOB|nr:MULTISPECIES: hypothetical protein [Halocynthiibacter]MCV6823407.1 hypothetical protein [Halocynthiibacter halioticoli]MCW4056408.1 hypothetical protein [Halocynthiibacter sp. SDUM655004]MDE0590626.1 hypothetical protein [Halocynthiibacter sp. C4]
MLFSFLRASLLGFAVLTVIYFIMRWYVFSLRREELEKEFDQEVQSGDRDAYVEAGMKEYRKSPLRKLLLLVYIVPLLLYVAVMYFINFN